MVLPSRSSKHGWHTVDAPAVHAPSLKHEYYCFEARVRYLSRALGDGRLGWWRLLDRGRAGKENPANILLDSHSYHKRIHKRIIGG